MSYISWGLYAYCIFQHGASRPWCQQTKRWTYFHNLKLSVTTWLFLHRFRQGFLIVGMQIVVPLSCLNFPIRTGSKNTRLWLISTWSESHVWEQAPSSALCWSQSIEVGLEFIPFSTQTRWGSFSKIQFLCASEHQQKHSPCWVKPKIQVHLPPRLFFTTSV